MLPFIVFAKLKLSSPCLEDYTFDFLRVLDIALVAVKGLLFFSGVDVCSIVFLLVIVVECLTDYAFSILELVLSF